MNNIEIDQPVPDFELPATGEQSISLLGLRGKNIVLYFYPKDSTPGCTLEGQNFRDLHDRFIALNSVILGVSRDGIKAHENFKAKQNFPFDLLSDKEEILCRLFDVIKPKKLYGKEFMGVERSTFIIDQEGILKAEWRKVKVKGHVDEVLTVVEKL
ncbi:MAG: peroxiredoxin [Gammaproteobacteria bacterium]|nr:peroxiredoxin [Gammaproteobacteria bacterium]